MFRVGSSGKGGVNHVKVGVFRVGSFAVVKMVVFRVA